MYVYKLSEISNRQTNEPMRYERKWVGTWNLLEAVTV